MGWTIALLAVLMTACAQKPSNEIEGIIRDVLKEDQGFTLDVQPHPKVK